MLSSDPESLVTIRDEAVGLVAFIAIDSTRRGPGAGGIRRMAYASEGQARADALRLACGMTLKNAIAELPAGGAKAVIMDTPQLDRQRAYEHIGDHVAKLGGRYLSGPDVGTTEQDLDLVRERAPRWTNPAENDAGRATARGVLAGIRAVLAHLDGDRSFNTRTFVVQGLGAVGLRVAEGLVAAGGDVIVADPSPQAEAVGHALGVRFVRPDAALATPCDVLVPCALGGILNEASVPTMAARAVCGSANNQLAASEVAERLAQRNILYAPDFVVSAGAATEGVYTMLYGNTDAVRAHAAKHIDATESRLAQVLSRAVYEGRTPEDVAWRVAQEKSQRPADELPVRPATGG